MRQFDDTDWHTRYADTFEPDGFASDFSIMRKAPLFLKGLPNLFVGRSDRQLDDTDYWARLYAGLQDENFQGWQVLSEVLAIDDSFWNAGPEAVAVEIVKIEARHLSKAAPLAEEVELNSETGKFHVIPLKLENRALIEAMVARTEDCIEDALEGANGLRENASEIKKLRRAHIKYRNDPQQIELTYTSVASSLRRQINDTQELARSEDNLALLEAIEEGALAVRAHHPEVAQNRISIATQKLREIDSDAVVLLEDAAPVLAMLSEDLMQEDFERDIPQLINDATLPVPTGAPPLPGMDESLRIFSRVSKMRLRYDKLVSDGSEIFDSKGFKTMRLGLTVGGILSALVTLGLSIFGVL